MIAVIDSGVELSHGGVGAASWVNAGEIAADGIDNDGNGELAAAFTLLATYGHSAHDDYQDTDTCLCCLVHLFDKSHSIGL